ncbi:MULTISPECIES: hypothetical protein [unclassified Francisella]|uniref:hypothetical protein n=1 Tax=unclassified Francisella TaxID=2610885 RepID=UPI002E32A28F|nr:MULTISPECIES: hypothetical protein [unclassified Francisella]MED7818893.1 hypothetical protein [Francisella sp. 19S2-4]MED7829730.1 hypothetical protein [Francisella sp. 19S2-10]
MPDNIFQIKGPMNLLELQKALGYEINKGGMCYGIAYMAIQAIIRNDFDTYIDRINLLDEYMSKHNSEDAAIQNLVSDIKDAEAKRKNKHNLNSRDIKLLSIVAWLDGIQIYHGLDIVSLSTPCSYIEKFKHKLNINNPPPIFRYQSYNTGTNLFSGDIYEPDKTYLKSNKLCFLNESSIYSLFEEINSSNEPIAFSIGTDKHIIAIGKGMNTNIYLINHNKHRILQNKEAFYKYIKFAFNESIHEIDKSIISISKFSNEKCNSIDTIYDKNLPIEKVLFLAMLYGNTNATKYYIKKILDSRKMNKVELLEAKGRNKYSPGFIFALMNSHLDTIEAYIIAIANSDIINSYKISLLAAIDINNEPGLWHALYYNNIDAIGIYLKTINKNHASNITKAIMNSSIDQKKLKDTLLKWALEYKPEMLKQRSEYPLLIEILSYNRSNIFKVSKTTSMKKFFDNRIYKMWN